MSQKPKFTHSAPLTADALAALFEAITGCETTRLAIIQARAILAEFGGAHDEDRDAEQRPFDHE